MKHQFGDYPPSDHSNSMEVNVYHDGQFAYDEEGHMLDIACHLVMRQNPNLVESDAQKIGWVLAHQLRDYGETKWKGYTIVRIKDIPDADGECAKSSY